MDTYSVVVSSELELGGDTPIVTQTRGLTRFDLAEPIVLATDDEVSIDSSGFADKSHDLLSREYYSNTFSCVIASANTTYIIPGSLLKFGFWAQYSAMFALVRWKKMKVRFLVRSVPMQFGAVMVGWIPTGTGAVLLDTATATAQDQQFNVGSICSGDPLLFSIADQTSVEMEIPFLCRSAWVSTKSFVGTQYNETFDNLFAIYMFTLCGLGSTDSNAMTPVTIDIFFQFVDLEFSVPIINQLFEAQSEPPGTITTTGVPYEGNGETTNWLTGWGRSIKTTAAAVTTLAAGYKMARQDAAKITQIFKPEKQGQMKLDTFGSTSTFVGEMQSSLDTFDDVTFIDPRRFADTSFKHSFADLIQKPYLISADLMTVGNRMTILCHPANIFKGVYTYVDGATDTVTGSVNLVYPTSYLGMMTQFFRYWRGSFKFKIYFFGSSLASLRFIVAVQWGKNSPAVSVFDERRSQLVVTVKGSAECEFEVPYSNILDWLPTNLWRATGSATVTTTPASDMFFLPVVSVYCAEGSSSGSRGPGAEVYVYMSAGDDFLFRSFQDSTYIGKTSKFEAQCRPSREFSKKFELMPGWTKTSDKPIYMEPQFLTVEEVLSRWRHMDSPLTTSDFNTDATYVPCTTFSGTDTNGNMYQGSFEMLLLCYKFNAGRIAYKVALDPAASTTGNVVIGTDYIDVGNNNLLPSSSFPGGGVVMTKADQWGLMDFEVPHLSPYGVRLNPYDYYGSSALGTPKYWRDSGDILTESPTVAFAHRWKKIGSNFQLFYLLPPPSQFLMQWNVLPLVPPMDELNGKERIKMDKRHDCRSSHLGTKL